jgi:hypothetical protein
MELPYISGLMTQTASIYMLTSEQYPCCNDRYTRSCQHSSSTYTMSSSSRHWVTLSWVPRFPNRSQLLRGRGAASAPLRHLPLPPVYQQVQQESAIRSGSQARDTSTGLAGVDYVRGRESRSNVHTISQSAQIGAMRSPLFMEQDGHFSGNRSHWRLLLQAKQSRDPILWS